MENDLEHKFELYSPEDFRKLLDHEIHRARRNGESLTLIHLVVETDSNNPRAQHGAEIFAINALNIEVRESDIPCKQGNEFLVLMPSTDEKGAQIVSERLEKLFNIEPQEYDKISFKLSTFIGMATLPGDRSITSQKLIQSARQAFEHAKAIRSSKAVMFSDLDQ